MGLMTSQEIAQRHSYARAMLERGCRVASVATMVSARFQVSRSTAYQDVRAASEEIAASEEGPAESETLQPLDVETIQGQLAHLIDVAAAAGDIKGVCQLVKAADSAKRWNGYQTPQGSWA